MNTPSPRTITLFIPDLEMGGAERVFVTLSRQFLQLGHGVRLILTRKTGPLLAELDPRVEVIDLAAGPTRPGWIFGLRTLCRLRRELRRNPPEAMLSTLTGANLVAIAARLLSGKRFPLVVREAVTLADAGSALRRAAVRLFYPMADHIVALTEPMAVQLEQRTGLSRHRIAVLPNPLDRERIEALSLDASERDAIAAISPYIVSIGRLSPQKAHGDLMHALALLDAPPRCVILGEGPQRAELEALRQELHLQDRVLLPGVRTNPYPWLRHASAFVLCSHWEGFPNALLEATHFRLPIIVTRYDASVDGLLSDYSPEQVRFVDCGDIQGIADALATLPSTAGHAAPTAAAPPRKIAAALVALLTTQALNTSPERPNGP